MILKIEHYRTGILIDEFLTNLYSSALKLVIKNHITIVSNKRIRGCRGRLDKHASDWISIHYTTDEGEYIRLCKGELMVHFGGIPKTIYYK